MLAVSIPDEFQEQRSRVPRPCTLVYRPCGSRLSGLTYSTAYRNLGRLYFRNQHYDDAVRFLEQARALNEDDWITWSFLGHAYYGMGDDTRAPAAA